MTITWSIDNAKSLLTDPKQWTDKEQTIVAVVLCILVAGYYCKLRGIPLIALGVIAAGLKGATVIHAVIGGLGLYGIKKNMNLKYLIPAGVGIYWSVKGFI